MPQISFKPNINGVHTAFGRDSIEGFIFALSALLSSMI
jgi:hypothetical protein